MRCFLSQEGESALTEHLFYDKIGLVIKNIPKSVLLPFWRRDRGVLQTMVEETVS